MAPNPPFYTLLCDTYASWKPTHIISVLPDALCQNQPIGGARGRLRGWRRVFLFPFQVFLLLLASALQPHFTLAEAIPPGSKTECICCFFLQIRPHCTPSSEAESRPQCTCTPSSEMPAPAMQHLLLRGSLFRSMGPNL